MGPNHKLNIFHLENIQPVCMSRLDQGLDGSIYAERKGIISLSIAIYEWRWREDKDRGLK